MQPIDKWRIRWSVLVGTVVLVLSLAAFAHESLWSSLGVLHIRPYFADTAAILAAGQAREAGLDIYAAPNPYDPLGRPHVYGPGWLVTGTLGLTVKDAAWLGAILVFAFIAAAVVVLSPRRGAEALVAALLLCSPPVLLGINRANNDLVVFLLLASAAWLLTRPRWAGAAGGGALLAGAAMLKLYPIVAVPAVLARGGRRMRLVALGVGVVASFVIVLWLWRDDFSKALAIAPRPETVFAYGLRVPLITWRALPGHPELLAGWAFGAAVVVLPLARYWRVLWNAVPEDGFDAACFVAGASCWCFCFVANTNYPYRAVLVLLTARLWLRQDWRTDAGRAGLRQLVLWLGALWLADPKNILVEVITSTTQPRSLVLSPGIVFNLVCTVEQAMLTMLTAALAVGLGGALFRRARTLLAES